MCVNRCLFGTDGVRGIANSEISPELAMGIGRAYGVLLHETSGEPFVLLGRDTRVSGTMLSSAIAAGLCSVGIDVTDCGVIPTPGLCLMARRFAASGAVMISASHNPPEFNGIKLLGASGSKLDDASQSRIASIVAGAPDTANMADIAIGRITPCQDFSGSYLDALLALFAPDFSLDGLTVVLDCAYGAACAYAAPLFERAGATVISMNDRPCGELINVQCGSLHTGPLAERVISEKADLGIAFDGDADRAMFVDETGTLRDGDFIKYILAADMQSRGLLEPPLVVGTVMSNLGLRIALQHIGVELARTDVGDRYVAAEMARLNAKIGGEQSGHIIFSDLGIGDGLYLALRVCEVLMRSGRSLSALSAPLCKVSQVLLNLTVPAGYDWRANTRLVDAVAHYESELGDAGRILLRLSGTEPLLRIMVEAIGEGLAQTIAEDLAGCVTHI